MRFLSDCNPADEGDPWEPRDDVCNFESQCLRQHDGGGICASEGECQRRREEWADERERERSE